MAKFSERSSRLQRFITTEMALSYQLSVSNIVWARERLYPGDTEDTCGSTDFPNPILNYHGGYFPWKSSYLDKIYKGLYNFIKFPGLIYLEFYDREKFLSQIARKDFGGSAECRSKRSKWLRWFLELRGDVTFLALWLINSRQE